MSVNIHKVLISDNVNQKCKDLLEAHGIEVVSKTGLSETELIQELKGCDGLIVRSDTKVTKEIIEAAKSLKIVGRAGTGVDNIDIEAATKNGIIVLNAPNGNSISACELTCSFVSCLARNVTGGCQSMKEGRWDRKALAGGSELYGKNLAVIGLGRIGKEVAARMKSYGMQILGYDPFVSQEETRELSIIKMDLEEIWPVADYITVHTPLIPQTRDLINGEVFAKCKRGVKIVNAARGGIINEESLLQALENGICSGAALDVFSEEPPKNLLLQKLISHPKVLATPHIGASTKEAQIRVAVEVAEQFVSLSNSISNYEINGILNAPALLASRKSENVAWFNLAEQLGCLIAMITGEMKYDLKNARLKISLAGPLIGNMRLLGTSALVGILKANKLQNNYNLINASLYARVEGLDFVFDTQTDEINVVKISVYPAVLSHPDNVYSAISVQGTVIGNLPYLMQIDDAVFPEITVQLKLEKNFVYFCEPRKMKTVVDFAVSRWPKIRNLSMGYGKQTWIVGLVETDKEGTSISNVLEIKHF